MDSKIIKVNKTAFGVKLARMNARLQLSWYFDKVFIQFPEAKLNTSQPLIIAINHSGWLDTAVSLFLVEDVLKRDYYMMAAIGTVKEHQFMRKFGVFGMDKDDIFSVSQGVRYAAALLQERAERCLVMFPQGDWMRSTKRPLRILPGTAQVARFVKHVTVVPVAFYYDIFLKKRPEVYIRIGEPMTFKGDVPPTNQLTEMIRQGIERELDAVQANVYENRLETFEIALRNFKYRFRESQND